MLPGYPPPSAPSAPAARRKRRKPRSTPRPATSGAARPAGDGGMTEPEARAFLQAGKPVPLRYLYLVDGPIALADPQPAGKTLVIRSVSDGR